MQSKVQKQLYFTEEELEVISTYQEYLVARSIKIHGRYLSRFTTVGKNECAVFGIDKTKKGWKKLNFDLTFKMKDDLLSVCLGNAKYTSKSMSFISKDENEVKKFTTGDKRVYLLRNYFNYYKIGISENPYERANTLSNASGCDIQVVGIWETVYFRENERSILRKFKKYRTVGEWFDFEDNKISLEIIEKHFDKPYKRLELLKDTEKYKVIPYMGKGNAV